MLAGFGDDSLTFAGVVDIADDMQVLVDFHRSAQAAATSRPLSERGIPA